MPALCLLLGAPPVCAQTNAPTAADALLAVRPGEIRLDGTLQALGRLRNYITLKATSFTLPGGKRGDIKPPRTRRIFLESDRVLYSGDEPAEKLTLYDLYAEMRLSIVGPDKPGDKFAARAVVVWNWTEDFEQRLERMEKDNKMSDLASVATFGFEDDVRGLLAKGADPNERDSAGYTPLMMAAGGNHTRVMEMLLARGARPNQKQRDGSTALITLAPQNHAEAAKLLLRHGADANAVSRAGFTALMLAIGMKAEQTARVLLEQGADPNFKTHVNRPPLHAAVQRGLSDLVVLMLAKGADPMAADAAGKTALDYALANEDEELIGRLREAAAQRDKKG